MEIFWSIVMWYLIGGIISGISVCTIGLVELIKSSKDKKEKVQEEVAFEWLKSAGLIAALWPIALYHMCKNIIKSLLGKIRKGK